MSTLVLPRSDITPSYASGYARSAADSANPSLWKGLTGAWVPAFGATGGTLRDVTSRNNHSTLTGMDPATDWVTTSEGPALEFSGSSQYASVPATFPQSTSALSVFVSLKYSAPTAWDGPIGNCPTAWTSGWAVNADSAVFNLEFWIESWSNNRATISYGPPSGWYTIAGTWDGATLQIYLDGAAGSSDTYSGSLTDVGALRVGGIVGAADRSWPGIVGVSCIWNRGLSHSEVLQLDADPLAPFRLAPLYIPAAGEAPPAGDLPPGSLSLLGVGV